MREADPLPAAWARAIALATNAPDASEAIPAMLAEAVPVAGADAGAVIDAEGRRCRGVWGCGPEYVGSLLAEGGALHGALHGRDPSEDEEVRISCPAPDGDATCSALLLALRVRELPAGTLLLLYPSGVDPSPAVRENARACAGLFALVLENDRMYEEARRALQARDHFLVALNHELRTPASALSLTADLLRPGTYGPLPEELDRILAETETHIQQMVSVLQRVLDLAGQQGQEVPERSDILRPREAVTELLRRVEPAARRKHLTLKLYVPRLLPPLQTDAARFSRILLYLLSNAIKYTSQGGIEVRIERAYRTTRPGRQEPTLIVRVKDTGRGIPPEELTRVFEPFTQVDEGARTDSRTRGLGLGLPLARRLARSLDGDITMESTPGRGTVASLHLPYTHP